jgi:transposase-like protein
MPKPATDRPTCPKCGGNYTCKDGRSPLGAQRYRCHDCGRKFGGGVVGRPTESTAMTNAERQRLWRQRHPEYVQKQRERRQRLRQVKQAHQDRLADKAQQRREARAAKMPPSSDT